MKQMREGGRASSLADLLGPVVKGVGLFLEGVETTRAGRQCVVRVFVDLPDGPGDLELGALQQVTSAVSAALDDADPVKGRYTLEVSTPGAERVLATPRHFRRAVGHRAHLVTVRGEVEGAVVQADEVSVTVRTEEGRRTLLLEDVTAARMVVPGF